MAKGGARARSGPAPDPNALRRERVDGNGWTILPAEGRAGDPPEWPLSRPLKREVEIWAREWHRPQAIMWERNGLEVEVAFYVRSLADAEKRGAAVTLRTLIRQQQEALGLSMPGMARNRWKIEATAETAPAAKPRATGGRARDRFRVVQGDGAG